jgi:hypothetical protein
MPWVVEFLDEDVQAAFSAMPVDIRASFRRIVELIGMIGLERVGDVTARGQRVVIAHVFAKKAQRTPRREIETALRRAREVQ